MSVRLNCTSRRGDFVRHGVCRHPQAIAHDERAQQGLQKGYGGGLAASSASPPQGMLERSSYCALTEQNRGEIEDVTVM